MVKGYKTCISQTILLALNTASHLFWTVPSSSLLPFKYYHIKRRELQGLGTRGKGVMQKMISFCQPTGHIWCMTW